MRVEVRELEEDVDRDLETIGQNIDDIKEGFHRAMIEQTEFRAQVREKLQITN